MTWSIEVAPPSPDGWREDFPGGPKKMRRFEIRTSTPVALVIIIFGLPVAGSLLFIGVANLINPDVSEAYYAQNTFMCLFVCLLGLASLLAVVAVARGLFSRRGAVTDPGDV
jgi:hypothetical protein